MEKKLTCLDLFCGAGGLSKGFLDAGYDVVLGIDYDDAALKTFQKNHGTATAMKLDLFDHSNLDYIVDFLKENKIKDLDVEFTPDNAAGQYSYLGINSVETGDAEMFVDTYAVYDTHRLTNPGNYIELTLTLSDKGDGDGYVTPAIGNPTNSGTPLNIGEYLTELKIYGADDTVIYDQTAAAVESDTRVTTKGDTIYTVRVRKDLLKTKSDGVYLIPITYKVKTGNTLFNSTRKKYSNYKVSLTAATYSSINSIYYSKPSYAFDHIIYTNARVLTSVVN